MDTPVASQPRRWLTVGCGAVLVGVVLTCGMLLLSWGRQPRANLIYPGAALVDPSDPRLYKTSDSYAMVVAWYQQRLPATAAAPRSSAIRSSYAPVSRLLFLPFFGEDKYLVPEQGYYIEDCPVRDPSCPATLIGVHCYPGCDQPQYGFIR